MKIPSSRGIRHVALCCQNLRQMEQFYCNILGYEVQWRPDEQNLYLSSGQDNLALHQAETSSESRLDHFGILVGEQSDVDLWAAYLAENKIVMEALPRTHRDGARSFYTKDPEGNRIQFLYLPSISSKK